MRVDLIYLGIIFCSIVGKVQGQTDIRTFIFGHSLIDHRPPAIATPSDETTVPHWLYLLAKAGSHNYSTSGQYGFLPQHDNLPPFSQWGYDSVPPVWDSDLDPFGAADFTDVLLTAGNFVQWQPPYEAYPGEGGTTPISATLTINDWVRQQEEGIRFFIYENWPDMAPYLSSGFPPSVADFAAYQQYTFGAFHDWWLIYHDSMVAARPQDDIKMIPVGPVIGEIIDSFLTQIPFPELYEDDAPHGRATLYFLAAMVTYSAIYAEEVPANFVVPSMIHESVRNSYAQIGTYIWNTLLNFNFESGESRVFFQQMSTADLSLSEQEICLFPNPATNSFSIIGDLSSYDIDLISSDGSWSQSLVGGERIDVDISSLPVGIIFIRAVHNSNNHLYFQKIIKP